MKTFRKFATSCYVIYFILATIIIPVVALILFFSEGIYKEWSYKSFKKYRNEFGGS